LRKYRLTGVRVALEVLEKSMASVSPCHAHLTINAPKSPPLVTPKCDKSEISVSQVLHDYTNHILTVGREKLDLFTDIFGNR